MHVSCVYNTVVSQVSAHGRLNITHDFAPHGRLVLGMNIPYICIEAATVAPLNAVLAWDTMVIHVDLVFVRYRGIWVGWSG